MILHVVEATVCGPHRLNVRIVDAEDGTVVWPNGSDLAPKAFFDRPSVAI